MKLKSRSLLLQYTTQKMKFSIKDIFSKCDQIRRKLQIWSRLLKKSLMENFIFCAVTGWIKEQALPIKANKMQTNNITEMKFFFGIATLLSFLVTNPTIYSFTLKVVLFKSSNRTLSFDSRYEKNEWSSNSFVIRKPMGWYTYDVHENCRFSIPSTPLSIYFQNSSTPLTLDVQFQPPPLPHPSSSNENQLIKKKHNPRMSFICYQVLPSTRLSFSVLTH